MKTYGRCCGQAGGWGIFDALLILFLRPGFGDVANPILLAESFSKSPLEAEPQRSAPSRPSAARIGPGLLVDGPASEAVWVPAHFFMGTAQLRKDLPKVP